MPLRPGDWFFVQSQFSELRGPNVHGIVLPDGNALVISRRGALRNDLYFYLGTIPEGARRLNKNELRTDHPAHNALVAVSLVVFKQSI